MGFKSNPSYLTMDGSIPDVGCCPFTVQNAEKNPRTENGSLLASDISEPYAKPYDESPSTASASELEQTHRRKYGYNHIPKLDRTMTDIYGDELYNPNFAITSTSPPPSHSAASTGSDVFNQRINAANHQHLSAAQSPASLSSRNRSPFRTSPSIPSPSGRVVAPHFPSSQRLSERDQNCQTQIFHAGSTAEPETPKTISPKDAILEFNESETDWVLPLFPQNSSNLQIDSLPKSMYAQQCDATYDLSNAANPRPHGLGHLPSQVLSGAQLPQQYPLIANLSASRDSPPRLSSSGGSSVDSADNTPDCHRPAQIGADSGTYTCTYHGCTLRFDTPTALQKHKREGHRQTQALVSSCLEPRLTSSMLQTQAGPHRCDRINPSTGKSCNTIFSRPYDLTRHEDTIHNARKQKVRCNLCTEEKSFSRADALTRHYRVCHPDVEFTGKFRRKGGA